MRAALWLLPLVAWLACDRRDQAEAVGLDDGGTAASSQATGQAAAPRAPRSDDDDGCGELPPDMACVPAGEFVRGLDHDPHHCEQGGQPPSGHASLTPTRRVWLDTFAIDRTEVTNASYRRCVTEGPCSSAPTIYPDFQRPKQPVTGVSWHDADRYCRWLARRLPTEVEWEKAARGPHGDLNPWGAAVADCDRAVIAGPRGRGCGEPSAAPPGVGRVLDVATRPPGRYGLVDMVGNAEEWVADWWTDDPERCAEDCLGRNPRGPCAAAPSCPGHIYKVVRGGSWYWPAEHAHGAHRRRHLPDNPRTAFHHFGFRCAADVR